MNNINEFSKNNIFDLNFLWLNLINNLVLLIIKKNFKKKNLYFYLHVIYVKFYNLNYIYK